MDTEDEELLNVWKIFSQHQLQYIMVGGFAVLMHGHSRFTADADVWVKDTSANRKKLSAALTELGIELPDGFESTDLIPGWSTIHLPSGIELDLMTSMKGMPREKFDECYSIAVEANIHGLHIHFLHLNHLLEAKRASARPQDLIDIAELEKLHRLK